MSTYEEVSCDVAIVGAGIAGLSTAHFLLQAQPSLNVLILEANPDRVGGRTLTKQVACADGRSRGWCFGGSHIGKSQKRIQQLARELGLTVSEAPETAGKSVLEIGDHIDRYEGETPNLGTLTLLDLDKALSSLDKQAKGLMQSRGKWANLDAMTLARKIDKETWKQNTRHCLTALTAACFDGEPEKISSLQALRIAQSAGGLMALIGEGDGLRIEEGAQAICTTIADRLGADHILLGHEITEIISADKERPGVTQLTTQSGKRVTARHIVLTLPLTQLSHLRFSPPLPPERQSLISAAATLRQESAESAVTAIVTYSEAFWIRRGCNGDVLSHLGSPLPNSSMPMAPVALAADATSVDGSQPALALATGYTREHHWPSPEARKADVLAHLARLYSADKAETSRVVDYVEHDWGNSAPMGASPLPVGSGAAFCETASWDALGGRVHFAGADFASEWIGAMEGAVESAQRVADRLLAGQLQ